MARPLSPKLSPSIIAQAALDAVDHDGEFTIQGIAKKLKVSPSSLYNHIDSKADVIELMRGQVMGRMDLSGVDSESADWAGSLRIIALHYRNAYALNPRLLPLVTAYSVRDATTIGMYNLMAQTLRTAGFDSTRQLEIITVIDNFVLGSALDAGAPDNVWAPGEAASPELRAALDAGLGAPDRAQKSFEFGLGLLLEGLAREAEVLG
ncbi:TetR/AcrR family transcriptional regulator [Arthrobacter russicus]|uniref:AcrR family transcriptional regulator n=1 Tax=Arthrobacter russicus TaxID=172040 RepID=A0ABU1JCZ4_9MICC|nr:TetR/AcrR family transcriptional regulator C-terminal domain-containing protein [Arthrobacter russicus]MDR6270304.1 AcrR family transcriptional regulator [Arthrobacter russicus]